MKSTKEKMKTQTKRPKVQRLKIFEKKKKINTQPIDDSVLSIREMKSTDRFDVSSLILEIKKEYYSGVYTCVFRSWFTYAIITGILALSLTFIQSSFPSVCLPPFLVTLFLIWKVKRYKYANRTYSVVDLEMLNMNETPNFKYKTSEQRRANQGVYLIFYKKGESLEDYDFSDSDLDLSSSESENETDSNKSVKDDDKNKVLIGYMVYGKERDALETVQIKEICIRKDYRKRCVAKNFLRRMCNNVFRTYGYRRLSFTASSFHTELTMIVKKKSDIIKKIQSWCAWSILPGVVDERTIFTINMNEFNK